MRGELSKWILICNYRVVGEMGFGKHATVHTHYVVNDG
jgi:hypothetical protein